MSWRRRLGSAALFGVLSLAYLAAAEAVIRWGWPQDKETTWLAGASLAAADETLGHALVPGAVARTRTAEFTVTYEIGEHGLRDASRYAPAPPRGTRRLLLLGDSFAFGEGVAYEDTWALLLETALHARGIAVEVVKAGVPGYDTRQECLLLERLGERFAADAVLLAFVANDLLTNRPIADPPVRDAQDQVISRDRERKHRPDLHLVALLRRALLHIDPIYTALYVRSGRAALFAADRVAEDTVTHDDSTSPDARAEALGITEALLALCQRTAADRGADFAVVSLPQQFQVIASATETDRVDVDVLDRHLGAFAARSGFPWIAVRPALASRYASEGKDLYYRVDGHLGAHGSRAVAEALVDPIAAWLEGDG